MFSCFFFPYFVLSSLSLTLPHLTPELHQSEMDALYNSILDLEAQTQTTVRQLNAALIENSRSFSNPNSGLIQSPTDMWTLQTYFSKLLDLYHDFIVAASTANAKHLLSTYRIPRRLWIYGVVAFIELLKNVLATNSTNSQRDLDIGPIFIIHAFSTIGSLYEIDEPSAWADKLAELARIAIQLYPANYLDWKVTASYWYHKTSVLGSHGHGKLYYHQCTVEYDNLLAFTLLSKSLLCKDPFVPTQFYLQSIIDNVCSQRSILSPLEMAMIDFVKIHKILLLKDYNSNDEMKSIVGHYSINFGVDSANSNFFDSHPQILNNNLFQNPNFAFWYSKAPFFAISNINHLLGLGNPLNIGAKVFGLVEKLKNRREKKKFDDSSLLSDSLDTLTQFELTIDQNYQLLNDLNKGVFQLSMNMLKTYLNGPIISGIPHVIVYLWFLISLSKSPRSNSKTIFVKLISKIFPWKELIPFINDIITLLTSREELLTRLHSLLSIQINNNNNNNNNINNNNNNNNNNSMINNQTTNQLNLPLSSINSPSGTILTEDTNSTDDHESLPGKSFESLQRAIDSIYKFNTESQLCYGTIWFDQINDNPPPLHNKNVDKPSLGELIPWDIHFEGEKYILILLLVSVMIKSNDWPLKFTSNGQWVKYSNKDEYDHDERLNEWFNDPRLNDLINVNNESINLELSKFDNQLSIQRHISNDNEIMEVLKNIKHREPTWNINSTRFMSDFINGIFPASLLQETSEQLVTKQEDDGKGYEAAEEEEDEEIEEEDEDVDEEIEDEDEDDEYYYDDDYEEDEEEDDVEDIQYTRQLQYQQGNNGQQQQLIGIEGDLGQNMDTILTFLSLDTNIWLKYPGRIYKCVKFGIFRLCVPLTIFQELRSLRRSQDMNIADSATRAVLIIRQLYQEVDLLPLRSNGTKANSLNETLEFEKNPDWRIQSDDLIIKSIKFSNSFGREYKLGKNFKVGPSPNWKIFDNPLKVGSIWSNSYMGGDNDELTLPNFSIRGSLLKNDFINSKRNLLSDEVSNSFWYNILISDDKNMLLKCKSQNVKSFDSEWLWKKIELVSCGRCYN